MRDPSHSIAASEPESQCPAPGDAIQSVTDCRPGPRQRPIISPRHQSGKLFPDEAARWKIPGFWLAKLAATEKAREKTPAKHPPRNWLLRRPARRAPHSPTGSLQVSTRSWYYAARPAICLPMQVAARKVGCPQRRCFFGDGGFCMIWRLAVGLFEGETLAGIHDGDPNQMAVPAHYLKSIVPSRWTIIIPTPRRWKKDRSDATIPSAEIAGGLDRFSV